MDDKKLIVPRAYVCIKAILLYMCMSHLVIVKAVVWGIKSIRNCIFHIASLQTAFNYLILCYFQDKSRILAFKNP